MVLVTKLAERFLDLPILLIGGAPRSGTTYLLSLFDAHPNVVIFHREILFLLDWMRRSPAGRAALVEPNSLLRLPKIREFVDLDHQASERRKKTAETGGYWELDCDPATFDQTYRTLIAKSGPTLGGCLRALAGAYWASSPGVQSTSPDGPALIAFKAPYYVDMLADRFGDAAPEAQWLHIVREPLSRYRSAKKRRLRDGRVPWLNHHRFVVGMQQVTFSAHAMASRLRSIPDHHLLFHEDLVADTEGVMRGLASDLGLDWHESLTQASLLGAPVEANTSFWRESSASDGAPPPPRIDLTNAAELDTFWHLSRAGNVFERYREAIPAGAWRGYHWFGRHQHERRRDYVRGILGHPGRYLGREDLKTLLQAELPVRLLEGRAGVSGAT